MKTKAVIYARVSTDVQQTKRQIDELQKWANDNNYLIVKTFDESISGFIENREELTSLKSFVKANDIKHILCYELSRLGRSTLQTLKEIDYFTKEGVNIFLKKDNLNTLNGNSANKLLLGILSSISEMEVSTFKERSASGRIAAKLKGRTNGIMTIPYGYDVSKENTLMINDIEAKIISEIFEMGSKGISLNGIVTHLNSLKVKTKRNSLWFPKVIRSILKNTIYKGIKTYKEHIINVPSIVSEEVWDKVNERFNSNIGYCNRSLYPYLFKGKLRCGKCGRTWVTVTKNKNTKYGFYFCSGIINIKGKCENGRYVNVELIDKFIFKSLFIHPNIDKTVLVDEQKKSKKEELKNQITFYKDEIINFEAKRKRLVNAYVDGNKDENDYKKELVTIKNTTQDLTNKIKLNEKALSYENDINLWDLLTSIYKSDDYNLKRDFIVKYIDKVEMNLVKETNLKWENELKTNDKIIYTKVFAFGDPSPIHVIMTTVSKQVHMFAVKNNVEFENHKLTIV